MKSIQTWQGPRDSIHEYVPTGVVGSGKRRGVPISCRWMRPWLYSSSFWCDACLPSDRWHIAGRRGRLLLCGKRCYFAGKIVGGAFRTGLLDVGHTSQSGLRGSSCDVRPASWPETVVIARWCVGMQGCCIASQGRRCRRCPLDGGGLYMFCLLARRGYHLVGTLFPAIYHYTHHILRSGCCRTKRLLLLDKYVGVGGKKCKAYSGYREEMTGTFYAISGNMSLLDEPEEGIGSLMGYC